MYSFYDDVIISNLLNMTISDKRHNFDACCLTTILSPTNKDKYLIGHILFNNKRMPMCVVGHELLHAALTYDRLINKNRHAHYGSWVNKKEEKLAEVAGALTDNFFAEWSNYVKKSVRSK